MKFSVIIPVLNEERLIGGLLHHLQTFPLYEVIVIDGGSSDQTVRVVQTFDDVILISSRRGRAAQMNHGATVARGDVLIFLHADSFLEEDAFRAISNCFQTPGVVAGSFYLKFDRNNFWLNIYSRCSKLNHSLFTYGDQGLFVRKDVFKNVGGFKELPLMEDLEIQRRLRKSGTFKKLDCAITTSARRYIENGYVKQQFKNILLVLLFLTGFSVRKLAKFY